ncbi:MAG TPA: beta-phosphoglucomutase [Clostridiales bacterium]|jgi:beta-phosphoglucomutase|nr:beta-phosphoglucomutase [Clostridiales bacterium]
MKAVIFDLDGVLCTTDKYHYYAWKNIADGLGIYFDEEINNRLRGVSRMESLNIILECGKLEVSEEEKLELAKRKNKIYRRLLENLTPRDISEGAVETIDKLRAAGLKLAVGSSSKNTPFILERLGLANYFDAISDGNNISRSKPYPEVFLKAAQMLGLESGECLVVEDALSGVVAAHEAGMLCACVGDAAKAGAGDYNMRSISELLDIVLKRGE